MKRLILMRHAKSSWDDPGLDDFDRPLNGRGKRSATALGDWLRQHDYLPDQILSSASMRTRETCERLKLDADTAFLDALYLADRGAMLRELRKATGDTVLMLGHNPGIAFFAQALVKTPPDHPRFDDYPTCATLVVDFPVDDWAALDTATGQVRAFVIPRELTA